MASPELVSDLGAGQLVLKSSSPRMGLGEVDCRVRKGHPQRDTHPAFQTVQPLDLVSAALLTSDLDSYYVGRAPSFENTSCKTRRHNQYLLWELTFQEAWYTQKRDAQESQTGANQCSSEEMQEILLACDWSL